MNILFLGYNRQETSLIDFLEKRDHKVACSCNKNINLAGYDLVISYGYPFIIQNREIQTSKRPIINLHIAFLPYNRGAHPNFWSHFENTPSGVSIHEIDEGVDTGPIIFQKEIIFDENETLMSSYNRLRGEIEDLFKQNIVSIESMTYSKFFPNEEGSFHKKSDLPGWVDWSMTIKNIYEKS